MDTRKRRKDGLTTLSPLFESLQASPKRARVHAQRKFAQGSQPNSPALTPVKETRELRDRLINVECRPRLSGPSNISIPQQIPVPLVIEPPIRPKTEDFLTFLCFRKTPMLPPELEFFETPQLLETATVDSRSQSPVRDDKPLKLISKKKEEITFEKKVFSKEPIKKIIEDLELDSQNVSPPSARVTRSSASLTPVPSFLSSPSTDTSPQLLIPKRKLTRKQLLLKKAALLKSKTLRAHRRSVQLRLRSNGEKEPGPISILESPKLFKSKLKLSIPSKIMKSAKILSMKKKEQISRVLRRMSSASQSASEDIKCRVTRSKVEPVENTSQIKPPQSLPSNEELMGCIDLREKLIKDKKPIIKVESNRDDVIYGKENDDLNVWENQKLYTRKITDKKELQPTMRLRDVRKKPKVEDKRVSRRLINTMYESTNSINPLSTSDTDNFSEVLTSSCQSRTKRSSSECSLTAAGLKSPLKPLRNLSDRSKSCDEKVSEVSKKRAKSKIFPPNRETSKINESELNIRLRPSRKTKQVAEVYLELISKKLAKESQKGKDYENDDELLDDDTISISSIKELEALSKDEHKDIQKCVQEFAEKHDKGLKEQLVSNDTRAKTHKSEKVSLGEVELKTLSKPACDSNYGSSVKKELNIKKQITNSSKEKVTLKDIDKSSVKGALSDHHNQNSPKSLRSPRSPRLTSSHQVHHNLRHSSIRNTVPHKVVSPPSPSKRRLAKSPSSIHLQSLSNKQATDKFAKSTSPKSTSIPKKRTLSDAVLENQKEKVSRRLSLDLRSPQCFSDSKNENLLSQVGLFKEKGNETIIEDLKNISIDKKNEITDSIVSGSDRSVNKEEVTVPVSFLNKSVLVDPILQSSTTNIEATSSLRDVKSLLSIPTFASNIEPVILSKKQIEKVKCMSISPRSKRTLSLDTLDKNKISANSKVTRLKKFSSLDNVGSSSKCESSVVIRPKQLLLEAKTIKNAKAISIDRPNCNEHDSKSSSSVRKSLFYRRRNSVHDETKLNELLESIAKDFKNDMDDSLYDKLEKDLNSGNKSPEKANKSILEIDKMENKTKLKSLSNMQAREVESEKLPTELLGDKQERRVESEELSLEFSDDKQTRNIESLELPPAFSDEIQASELVVKVFPEKETVSNETQEKEVALEEKEVVSDSRVSPIPSSASSPTTSSRKSNGKKLCEVVRNLQVRKQAESPLSYTEMETPTFVQDLKALEAEKQKQVSEEQNAMQKLDIAPTPSISSTHFTDLSEEISSVNVKSPPAHSCTSETDAQLLNANAGECENVCLNESINPGEIMSNQPHENKGSREEQAIMPNSSVYSSLNSISTNLAPILTVSNTTTLPNTNVSQTYVSMLPVTSEPMLSMPISNLNITVPTVTINPGPLTNLSHPTSIGLNVTRNQIPATLMSSRISHFGHGVTINPAAVATPAIISEFKPAKSEPVQKSSCKQILIAPKPAKNSSGVSSHGVGSSSMLKHLPKPVQIAPKLPNTSTGQHIGHLHSATPIISGSPMGHMIQGVPHPVQTVQTLQAVQALPQQVQAITPNFSSIAGMTSAVPAVITQPLPIFVTSSMPSMMSSPFDISMQNHLHGNVGAVARVVTQNMVQKINMNHKSQGSIMPVNSGTQPLVSISSGNVGSNGISSMLPYHQGHPTQFVTLNMVPMGSQINMPGAGHITSSVGPLICSQAVSSTSGVQVPCSVASISGSLNIIPSVPILPLHDVNIGTPGMVHPLSCAQANSAGTQVLVSSAGTPMSLVISSSHLSQVQENSLMIGSHSINLANGLTANEMKQEILDNLSNQENENTDYFNSDEDEDASNMDISLEINESGTSEDNEIASQEINENKQNDNNSKLGIGLSVDINEKQPVAIGMISENYNSSSKTNSVPAVSQSVQSTVMSSSRMVSQALSEIFPLQPIVLQDSNVCGPELGLKATNAQSLKKNDPLSSETHLPYHSQHLPNVVINNFVYTTPSVVIPKIVDHGMTSPRAVTKVSQSSPPYVLSTSTSNEYSHKSPKGLVSSSFTTSQQPPVLNSIVSSRESAKIEKSVGVSDTVNNNVGLRDLTGKDTCPSKSIEKDLSNEPISKILSKFVSSAVTVTAMPMKGKGNLPKKPEAESAEVQSNWSPRTFYSSNVIKTNKVDIIKSKRQKVENVKANLTFDSIKSKSELKSSNSKAKENEKTKLIKEKSSNNAPGTAKPSIKSSTETLVNGKELQQKCRLGNKIDLLQKRKEPIIKRRTLFKTKYCDDQKTSDAFSPLNESSVYAFEPDSEGPLEVTTPFYQRIKNIQPSPQTSAIKSSPSNNNIPMQVRNNSSNLISNSTESKDDIKIRTPNIDTAQSVSLLHNVQAALDKDKSFQPTKPILEVPLPKNKSKRNPTQTVCKKGTFAKSIKEVSISISIAAPKTSTDTSLAKLSPENKVYKHPTPVKDNMKFATSENCNKNILSEDNKNTMSNDTLSNVLSTPSKNSNVKLNPLLPILNSNHSCTNYETTGTTCKSPKHDPSSNNILSDNTKTGKSPVESTVSITKDKNSSWLGKDNTNVAHSSISPTKVQKDTSIAKENLVVSPTKSNTKVGKIKKGSRPFPSKSNFAFGKNLKCNSDQLPFAIACERVPLIFPAKNKRPLNTSTKDIISTPIKADIAHENKLPQLSKTGCIDMVTEPVSSFKGKSIDVNKKRIQKVTKVAISEAYDGHSSEDNIKDVLPQSSSSTSIAIQCDLDDSQSDISQDETKGSDSGTQTEKQTKFPLPPSASPFYYLPLAMATLGEKLPAQLVQQMLAKTQGLVGAAEAGLILQQAAQLAQQYHKNSEDEGPHSLPPSSAVKPISPKSGSIALQKALRANLASMAQAEISVAQNTGAQLSSQCTSQITSSLLLPQSTMQSKQSVSCTKPLSPKGLLKIAIPEMEANFNINKRIASHKISCSDDKQSSVNAIEEHNELNDKELTGKNYSFSIRDNSLNKQPELIKTFVDKNQREEKEKKNSKPKKVLPKLEIPPVIAEIRKPIPLAQKVKKPKIEDVLVKRRSGRSTTLASTKATEFDLHEAEEIRRSRRAKKAAAVLAREEGWSSSSEPPLSPSMSPDVLRGWPPPRLTSPTPSQSSEGTTASSTPSQRSRVSAPHSRRHSPAGSIDSRRHGRYSNSSTAPVFPSDPVIDPEPLHITDNPKLSRAPSFFPSEEEFTEPLDYIEKIRPEAEQFGLCRIVPPSNFRPECRVNDDMRFTAYRQYTHRMMMRWGPSDRTLCAIKKCLAKQNIELTSNPLIGGLELDLVYLYNVVEDHGGLMNVIEKELWPKVSDVLRIPKSAQDRVTKLDSIYCKYLLPYAMLAPDERQQLFIEVDAAHSRLQNDESSKKSGSLNSSDNEEEEEEEPLECIVKGKSTALSAFYRIARNIASQWQPDPDGLELDERYWDIVKNGNSHVCVHAASIDTAEHCYGFPSQKNSSSAKHPWNLKNLVQNPNSILRSMGNVIGVTAPTLHVGMMFSTVCWYRDPHSLPWVEYLHTGASKMWYGVASNNEDKFRAALKKLVPDFIKDSPVWLPSDTAMVPPDDLVEEDVKVCRVVQEPGQFVVVFPGAFTSSVCSGYLISESAFFARPQYFERAVASFKTLFECFEPSMFSLDRLALSVASDSKATSEALMRALPVVQEIVEREKRDRKKLLELGLTLSERMSNPSPYRKKKKRYDEDEEITCEICRQHLYVSLVFHSDEEISYCLHHAVNFLINNKNQLRQCKLLYSFSLPELTSALKQLDERIQIKSFKKSTSIAGKRGRLPDQDSFSSTSSSNL